MLEVRSYHRHQRTDEEMPPSALLLGTALTIGETAHLLPEDGEDAAPPWANLPLTTAPSFKGRPVVETLEIIAAECALGMNFLRDLSAAASDIFGGRSGTWQRPLRRARALCMNELRREAYELGADAVVAVDFDDSEIGASGSMFFVVASGTAVRRAPEAAAPVAIALAADDLERS